MPGVWGEVWELSPSRVTRWLHALRAILQQAWDDVGVLPTRERGQFARHERGPQDAGELSSDGTDRRRQRPKSQEKHAWPSSGKPKTPRDQNVGVVKAKPKRVGYLRQTSAGKLPAKKRVATEAIRSPRAAIRYQDTGLQGDAPAVAQTHQPKKSRAKGS